MHDRRRLVTALVLGAVQMVGLSACKASQWKRTTPEPGATGTVVLPRRVGADVKPTGATLNVDIDEKTGRPKVTLVLRLDYFPEPRPGATNLPTCYESFPAALEVGSLECVEKPELKQVVLAKNVDQDCYTNPKSQRVPATEPLSLVGCRRAQLTTFSFDPEMRIDAEVRDVN